MEMEDDGELEKRSSGPSYFSHYHRRDYGGNEWKSAKKPTSYGTHILKERLRYGLNWQHLFIVNKIFQYLIDSMGGNYPKVRLLSAYAKTVRNFMPWSVV